METDTKRLQNTVLEAMSPCAGCQENNESQQCVIEIDRSVETDKD